MFSHKQRAVSSQKRASNVTRLQLLVMVNLLVGLFLSACTSTPPTTSVPATPTAAQTALPATVEEASATPELLGLIAYIRDGVLYIQNGNDNTAAIPVEDCSENKCDIYHLEWSPTASQLLYYIGSYDGTVPDQIRLADASGVTQTVVAQPAYIQPAGWSWDGTHIAYRTDTDRYAEVTDGPAMRIQELWLVDVADDGALGTPDLRGELTFGEGCGGGGRSESANLYEREGGFAYGYLSGVMFWTPADILLHSDNCTTIGVSRFDLANNTVLEPLPGGLRSLSLNAAGDAWVAINDQNQIVTGTPDSLDATVIPSSMAPELIFYGKLTGTIYYTTLEITDRVDLIEQASAWMDPAINVFPYFDLTNASIIALDPNTGAETLLYADDTTAYAYAQVAEHDGGGIYFSRVEGNIELQTAVENETLTADNWRDYLPTVDVLYLAPGDTEATVVVANAAQYTTAN